MAMDVREKIVELLTEFYGVDPMYLGAGTNALIEYLIATGVTVQETARRCVDGKPVTNADRIRAMSDEELAMCLYEIGYDEGWDKPEYALKWLQQPTQGMTNGKEKTAICGWANGLIDPKARFRWSMLDDRRNKRCK